MILLINVLFFLSCERQVTLKTKITDERTPLTQDSAAEPVIAEMPDQLFDIVHNRCLRCHQSWGDNKTDVQIYLEEAQHIIAGQPEESLFYLKLLENPSTGYQMPIQYGIIGENWIAKIRNWINGGGQRNDEFENHMVPFFQGFCADCHIDLVGENAHPDDIYDSLTEMESNGYPFVSQQGIDQSLFYLKIVDPPFGERMPISYPLFNTEELALVESWIRGED